MGCSASVRIEPSSEQLRLNAGDLLGAIGGAGTAQEFSRHFAGILHGDRFILMPASSNDIGEHTGEHGAELSVFLAPNGARSAFSAAAALDCGTVLGTVDAEMKPVERHFYGPGGRTVTLGAPLGSAGVRKSVKPTTGVARVRANDLIGELREISGQVNRMMAQVERAIDRLAIDAR